ncbi:molybdenum cofactor guanylyltransferase [Chamaesiphon sp.]|uniref:molybdenum cofactor guanylyltransferase n=1 Tax=Chamaesiphon sp. TaxID=2814140 RepID=UPI003592F58B
MPDWSIVNANTLSVIILAGGRSSRMGRDKATIEIAGVPLIRHIYDVVAGCRERSDGVATDEHGAIATDDPLALAGRIYVVTPWAQKYRSILPATCQFIPEPQPHRGPLIAFSQGLATIDSDWMLLLACDLPNLATPVVQTWIDGLPSVPAQSIAYLPRHPHKGLEPLCGFYRRSCRQSAHEYIASGGQSFQGWLKMHPVTELIVSESRWLLNCNTPADLATIGENRSLP